MKKAEKYGNEIVDYIRLEMFPDGMPENILIHIDVHQLNKKGKETRFEANVYSERSK